MWKRWQKDWKKFAGLEVSLSVYRIFSRPNSQSSLPSKNMKLIKRLTAFTLIELLVVISIIAILASLTVPAVTGALVRGQSTQLLSNMKQLHLTAQQIALDGSTSGDTNLAWPGDLPTKTWTAWAGIVTNGYMTVSDLAKMCSSVPITASSNTITTSTAGTTRAVIAYQVSETNDSSVVIFSSSNFTNLATPVAPVATGKPFGNKGFVVFRKGGDGIFLQVSQATNTNVIGGAATVLN
jgi:prepilin-type N-terminal cleavage/methylation domain-containing protein